MIRTPANFFRKCDKFAKDSGIYKEREGLEYWNTGIQQKKGGICIVLIWSPRIGPPFFSSRFMDRNTQVSSSSLFPAKR